MPMKLPVRMILHTSNLLASVLQEAESFRCLLTYWVTSTKGILFPKQPRGQGKEWYDAFVSEIFSVANDY